MGYIRRWFGDDRVALWQKLAQEMEGNWIDGGAWKSDRIEVRHEEWTIVLDLYVLSTGKTTSILTRMRAPYANAEDFQFSVGRHGFFADLGLLFGGQDIAVGFEPFDSEFIVKGNDEDRVRTLLADPQIRAGIEKQKDIRFCISPGDSWLSERLPEGVDQLAFYANGIISDTERLKALFELFADTLDGLCRMGVAEERTPEGNR